MTVAELYSLADVQAAKCRPMIVKVSSPIDEDALDIPVLRSESGVLYEVGPLIRTTRLGSVHRLYKLTSLSGGMYTQSEDRLAVKAYSKRALMRLQAKQCEENPVSEMITLSLLAREQGHPSVMQVREIFADDEFFYMIMPFVAGGDLMDTMERRTEQGLSHRFPPAQAKTMFRDIVSGLQFLHSKGIAHRDLSLENILYDESTNQYVIIDLGMCLCLPPDGMGGFLPIPARPICGKLNYIAPEIWTQQPWLDPTKCDIWAAGVILFMVLTAAAPMEQATASDPHFCAIANNRLLDVLIAANEYDSSLTFEEQVARLDPELLQAMDLVQQILRPDPCKRISLEEILAHPWMQEA